MFKMVSEYGNAVYYVETKTEKEDLERRGFTEEKTEEAKPTTKGRGVKNERTKN